MLNSIKGKLILWFTVVLAGFILCSGYFLHHRMDRIVRDSVDNILHSKVEFISGLIEVERAHIEVELSEVMQGEYSIPRSGHYYRVLNWNSKEIVRSPSLVDFSIFPPLPPTTAAADLYDVMPRGPKGEPVRWLTHVFKVEGDRYIIVQAGEGLTEAYGMVHTFTRLLLLLAPVGLIILLAGAVLIVQYSLVPLRLFSEKVGLITHKNLNERLAPESEDRELQDLSASFNTTLDRLEAAFEQEKRFVSDASHELKTPVSVIKSQCDVILRRPRNADEYKEALIAIKAANDRMAALVESLLGMARLDSAGATVLRTEAVLLGEMANKAIEIIRPIALERNISVEYIGHNPHCLVNGDRDKLAEVLVSLLDNAVKYNRYGGKVTLELSCDEAWSVIEVKDTGVGIAEADRKRVFERFWRADVSRTVFGAGLGLSIAKGIVESHGGRIEVKSELGQGSCFTVYLPRSM